MAKELANTSGGGYLANNDDYFAQLAQEAAGLKGGGGGKAFMKFDGNDGSYSYGADDEPLELGDRLIMDPASYRRGWVIWVDGDVVYESMLPLGTSVPAKHQLEDFGPYGEDDGPVEQQTIDFRMEAEPYTEMVFQANNVSKRRALAALLKDFGNTYKAHPGEVPIIELDENEFLASTSGKDKGKKGGRKVTKHAPKFKIVGWASIAKLEAARAAESGASEEDDAPRARRSAALEDKREEDDRPARRSRREEPEEDDRPARRTRREEPAEDDEPPARRTRREEPAEDDEPPARRSRREEPADEDEAPPRRSAARREEPDEEDERPARRTRREEVEDEPAPARRAAARDEEEPAEDERPARRRPRF